MSEFDPEQPLPRWDIASGQERSHERIDVLIEQLRRLWKEQPELRLCQLLVNLCDDRANRLFYLEDHTVSQRIFEFRKTGNWPSGRAHPPDWILRGEPPPDEVRQRWKPIFDAMTERRNVTDDDAKRLLDAIVERPSADDDATSDPSSSDRAGR